MKVLSRYIAFEVAQRALVILGVITALMLLAKGLDFLEQMAQGEIPGEAVLALLGLALPKILALALPLALFFGLLTTVARLCVDSEMDAMAAAGVGLYNLLPLIGVLGGVGMALEAAMTLWLEPAGEARLAKATASFQEQALTSALRAGQFNTLPGGRVLFFRERASDGRMQEVFFHDPDPEPAVTVTARLGQLAQGEDRQVEAVFFDGVRYQGQPSRPLVRTMRFDRYRVRKSLGEVASGHGGREALPTPTLWERAWGEGEGQTADRVELFRRLVFPLSLPVLLLLALPLGVENRRSGTRSYGILWGALLVLAYHNGLIVLEDWAGNGVVAPHWVLWAALVPVLALALFLLNRTVHGLPMLPGRDLVRRNRLPGKGETA